MSETTLKIILQEQMKAAMRAKEKEKLAVIRLMLAAIKQVEVDERKTPTDTEILSLLDKMVKQRKESIRQFEVAKRDDLIAQETFEIGIIQQFLPEPLTDTQISTIINETIARINPEGMQDMSKIIGAIREQVQGRADMGKISQMVKGALSNHS